MDEETRIQSQQLAREIVAIAAQPYPSLCELETLGASVKAFRPILHTDPVRVLASWKSATSDSIHSGNTARTSTSTGDGSPLNFCNSFQAPVGSVSSFVRHSSSQRVLQHGPPTSMASTLPCGIEQNAVDYTTRRSFG